jgi:hypothetical protein
MKRPIVGLTFVVLVVTAIPLAASSEVLTQKSCFRWGDKGDVMIVLKPGSGRLSPADGGMEFFSVSGRMTFPPHWVVPVSGTGCMKDGLYNLYLSGETDRGTPVKMELEYSTNGPVSLEPRMLLYEPAGRGARSFGLREFPCAHWYPGR